MAACSLPCIKEVLVLEFPKTSAMMKLRPAVSLTAALLRRVNVDF